MTERLYLGDSYLREFTASVVSSSGNQVVLDRTALFARSGGQPSDTGVLEWGAGRARVWDSFSEGDDVVHCLDGPAPPAGTRIRGVVDWNRRYRVMRLHTSLHILSGVAFRKFGATITGSQIYEDRARMDFGLPEFDRSLAEQLVREANGVVMEGRPVVVRWVGREEFFSSPSLMRVDRHLYPDLPFYRVVEIVGFDAQADGGTHVANTREVGEISLSKVENKGRMNRRIEVVVP
jgi:misacylated tRNA(Ala) deacylase